VRWADALQDAGRLGEVALARLLGPGVLLVGTMRADGGARISPCEPFGWDGELWLPMLQGSHKAHDLRRDARVLLHSVVVDRDGVGGELKLRGRAVEEHGVDRRAAVCAAVGAALPWSPDPGRVDLFAVDVGSLAHVEYIDGDQHVALWPEMRRFVRRITSATSVGAPEPLSYD
jgi:hypothetical protein